MTDLTDWKDNITIKAKADTLTTEDCFAACSEVLSSDAWQGKESDENYLKAELTINQWLLYVFERFDVDEIDQELDELGIGPAQTIIADRLNMMELLSDQIEFEQSMIEIDSAELDAAIASGQVQELTGAQVREKLGTKVH